MDCHSFNGNFMEYKYQMKRLLANEKKRLKDKIIYFVNLACMLGKIGGNKKERKIKGN